MKTFLITLILIQTAIIISLLPHEQIKYAIRDIDDSVDPKISPEELIIVSKWTAYEDEGGFIWYGAPR